MTMKIPLQLLCNNCKRLQTVSVNLNDTSFQLSCQCGENLLGSLSTDVTTGIKLIWRSRYELVEKKDYCLSIVFSAAALECELSRLYFKWKDISALEQDKEISNDELEKYLRNYYRISTKLEEVAKLMDPRGFTQFVKETDDLRQIVEQDFPSLTIGRLSKSFQEKLFWPRNRILHLGDSCYGIEDANRCFNIANLGLKILEVMDKNKRIAS